MMLSLTHIQLTFFSQEDMTVARESEGGRVG